ncbi:MAG: plasmid pRiA4b ORF-3 family protein [Moorea sp. SIO2I5]|nr:plasmid pRiA4b ORF-3 family protein [Moorena sp. SIO2I5]
MAAESPSDCQRTEELIPLTFPVFSVEEKSVRKTKINQVFKKDKEMLFLFDYGDEWLFHILCLDDEVAREPRKRYPKLIDQKGEAPEQYPDYDDEDYDEE